jgi:3-oxoadipate enol-lactonase
MARVRRVDRQKVDGGSPFQGSSLCHVARGMTEFDVRGRLAAIRAPALVICGEHDLLFSPGQTREISGQIAGSRYSLISGAGHLSSLDS